MKPYLVVSCADFFTQIFRASFKCLECVIGYGFEILDFTLGAFQVDFYPVDCRAVIFARTLFLRTALVARLVMFAVTTALIGTTFLGGTASAGITTAKAESGSFGKCFATAFAVSDFAFFEDLFALFCIEDANMFDLVAT